MYMNELCIRKHSQQRLDLSRMGRRLQDKRFLVLVGQLFVEPHQLGFPKSDVLPRCAIKRQQPTVTASGSRKCTQVHE